MKVLSLIVVACLGMAMADHMEEESFRTLQKYIDTLPEEEQSQVIQGFVDNVVESLVKQEDKEKLLEFYDAMETVANAGEIIDKRQTSASEQAHLDNLKRGHCCLGGELVVTYAPKTITILTVNSVSQDKNTAHQSCGTWGWGRCHTTTNTKNNVHYEHKTVDVKVPLFTCHEDRAVCCHGFVEIKKLPGDLGQLGAGNCIQSSQALFTIFNLQLFERVSEGKILLTEGQMDKVFDTVQKFFTANGIEQA